jgi:hypothetical protein
MGFSPGFSEASAKAHDNAKLFLATLKRCFPLPKQGAPTKNPITHDPWQVEIVS